MTFRFRIAISAAAAVALTVVLASILVYVVARGQLREPVDAALEARAAEISGQPLGVVQSHDGDAYLAVRPEFGEARGYVQLVRSDGSILVPPRQDVQLPVGDGVRAIASKGGHSFWKDVDVHGTHTRVLTFAYGPGAAVQVARPLTEVEKSLNRIGLFLLLIAVAGVVIAAGLGLLVARAALTPVQRLTSTVERVTETKDLSERIDVEGKDELSRLAASFNTMLAALEESTRAQRQLVADASHELRTPLTSVRTNIEVLAGDRTLPPDERDRLLSDVVEQLGEMTTLISELIELARAEQHSNEPEDVRLDLLVADVVERARRNRPEIPYSVELEPSTVQGVPATIERAVGNLLDNAAKWSPPGTGGRGGGPRRTARRARSRPGHRRRGPSVRLRPLLSSSRRSRDAGLGPRPRDRPPGRRVARRECRRRACGRWRHAHGAHHRGSEPRDRRLRARRIFLASSQRPLSHR